MFELSLPSVLSCPHSGPAKHTLFEDFVRRVESNRQTISVVGDVMVDEDYQVHLSRISPEYPVPVMVSGNAAPKTRPGGAANVAHQLKHFNADVRLHATADLASQKVFRDAGINCDHVTSFNHVGRGITPRKKRFFDGGHPVHRWDVEVRNPYDPLIFQNLSDAVIFSDYGKGAFSQLYGLPPAKISVVDPKDDNFFRWEGCTVFKPNAVEAEKLSGSKNWDTQCEFFRDYLKGSSVVITQGGDGVVGLTEDGFFEYRPNKVQPAKHPCGAGDCFAAVFTLALTHGFPVQQAAEIAFEAGAVYVQQGEPVRPRQLHRPKLATAEELRGISSKKVFTNGCFDYGLTAGHVEVLNFAKAQGEVLIVGVNDDASVLRLKGPGRPKMPLDERLAVLESVGVIDHLIAFSEDTPLELIQRIRPDIVVKGGDYRADEVVSGGAEVRICPARRCVSTTDKFKA